MATTTKRVEVRNIRAHVIEKYPLTKRNVIHARVRARQLHRKTGEPHFVYRVTSTYIYTSSI